MDAGVLDAGWDGGYDGGYDAGWCADGDDDGDGVCNGVDICPEGDDVPDIDADGRPDGCEPRMVRDVHNGGPWAGGELFFPLGGLTLFKGATWEDGEGLWITDGTPQNTRRVWDAVPVGLLRFEGAELDGFVYFAAEGSFPRALWRTDGTSAGTSRVATSMWPRSPRVAHGRVYYVRRYNSVNYLWSSDHSDAGPIRHDVPDGGARSLESVDGYMEPFGNHLYFSASDSAYGAEVWRTDGTIGGTELFADLNAGSSGSGARVLSAGPTKLYIAANDGSGWSLWATDGSAPVNVGPMGTPDDYKIDLDGDTAYFTRNTEPWVSDGTPGGASAIQLADGGVPVEAHDFVRYADHVYFLVQESAGVFALWRTSGATGIAERAPGSGTFAAIGYTRPLVYNGKLYFSADDGTTGRELWVHDGATTSLLADYWPGQHGSDPVGMTIGGDGQMYFRARIETSNPEPWISDGTAAGTRPLLDNYRASPNQNGFHEELAPFGDGVIFAGYADYDGVEPWLSDGTFAGTQLLADLHPDFHGAPRDFVAFNGFTYFSADTPATGRELFRTDGTPGGTELVVDLNAGPTDTDLYDLTATTTHLVFRRGTNSLMSSNGDLDNAEILYSAPGSVSSRFRSFSASGAELFVLSRARADNGWLVVGTDGTPANTAVIADENDLIDTVNYGMMAWGGDAWFGALDNANADTPTIWRASRTRAPEAVLVLSGGQPCGSYGPFATLPGVVLLMGSETGVGISLYASDGSTTTRLTTLVAPGESAGGACPERDGVVLNGVAYFSAGDPAAGRELWRSDGTPGGTYRVADINPGAAHSQPLHYALYDGRIYFVADDGVHGDELWRSDGTPGGTALEWDLEAGTDPAAILPPLVGTPSGLFFGYATERYGEELYVLPPFGP
jgi:ELWxxDGT repeat protein